MQRLANQQVLDDEYSTPLLLVDDEVLQFSVCNFSEERPKRCEVNSLFLFFPCRHSDSSPATNKLKSDLP